MRNMSRHRPAGWLLCGVLDISAAFVQSWIQAATRHPRALRRHADRLGRETRQIAPDAYRLNFQSAEFVLMP
jgi:hypothetical protein